MYHRVLILQPMQNCGLIAESRMIDERSEWRTFGDKVLPTTFVQLSNPFLPDKCDASL